LTGLCFKNSGLVWIAKYDSPLISASQHPQTPPKLRDQVYLSVLQHPTKYQAKILTGKFCSWRKTKYPL